MPYVIRDSQTNKIKGTFQSKPLLLFYKPNDIANFSRQGNTITLEAKQPHGIPYSENPRRRTFICGANQQNYNGEFTYLRFNETTFQCTVGFYTPFTEVVTGNYEIYIYDVEEYLEDNHQELIQMQNEANIRNQIAQEEKNLCCTDNKIITYYEETTYGLTGELLTVSESEFKSICDERKTIRSTINELRQQLE